MIKIESATLTAAFNAFADKIDATGQEFLSSFSISAGREARKQAQALTRERLPSGGGTYVTMFHTSKSKSKHKVGVWLKNNHDWHRAIEYGTKPHPIEAKMGTVASRMANKFANSLGLTMKGDRVPITTTKGPITDLDGSVGLTLGQYDADTEKITIAGKSRRYRGSPEMINQSYVGQQSTKLHELIHRRQHVSRGTDWMSANDILQEGVRQGHLTEIRPGAFSGGDAAIQQYNAMIEIRKDISEGEAGAAEIDFQNYVQERKNLAKAVFKKGDTGQMEFSHVQDNSARLEMINFVPGGAKNLKKDVNVKYTPASPPIYATKINHPGARAFLIMTDTAAELSKDENLNPIIDTAWKNAERKLAQ